MYATSKPSCEAIWGLKIVNSINIHIFGAGLYNWFQDYIQPYVNTQDCQQRVVYISGSSQTIFYNLYTIGTVEMLNAAGIESYTCKGKHQKGCPSLYVGHKCMASVL